MCITCISPPPASSNFIRQNDMFDILETAFVKYNELGTVYITGDLNSRTEKARKKATGLVLQYWFKYGIP